MDYVESRYHRIAPDDWESGGRWLHVGIAIVVAVFLVLLSTLAAGGDAGSEFTTARFDTAEWANTLLLVAKKAAAKKKKGQDDPRRYAAVTASPAPAQRRDGDSEAVAFVQNFIQSDEFKAKWKEHHEDWPKQVQMQEIMGGFLRVVAEKGIAGLDGWIRETVSKHFIDFEHMKKCFTLVMELAKGFMLLEKTKVEKGQQETETTTTLPAAESGGAGASAEEEADERRQAVEQRVEEELQRLFERMPSSGAGAPQTVRLEPISHLERKSSVPPAGVVVLSEEAERRVLAALAPFQDDDGLLRLALPKRFRCGKPNYERLNEIYLGLESFGFSQEQLRSAMSRTLGYDIRAALEFLLVNTPGDQLPPRFGGEVYDAEPEPSGHASAPMAASALPEEPDTLSESPNAATHSGSDDTEAWDFVLEAYTKHLQEQAPGLTEKFRGATAAALRDLKSTATAPVAAPAGNMEAHEEASSTVRPDAVTPAAGGEDKGAAQRPDDEEGEKASEDSEEKARTFHKRWLEQYAQASETESEESLDDEARLERERRSDPTARYLALEKERGELHKILKHVKQTLAQDMQRAVDIEKLTKTKTKANARMGSIRREMEALLTGKWGKLDRVRLDKAAELAAESSRRQHPGHDGEVAAVAECNHSGSGGESSQSTAPATEAVALPSLFADDVVAGGTGNGSEALGLPLGPQCRQYGIASWKGKTPKKLVAELVRKELWGKHSPCEPAVTYQEVNISRPGAHRAVALVKLPGQAPRQVDPGEPCGPSLKDAENLAACRAIFELQLYPAGGVSQKVTSLLPPAYRQRWEEWQREATERFREENLASIEGRVKFLDEQLHESSLATFPLSLSMSLTSAAPETPVNRVEEPLFPERERTTESVNADQQLRAEWRQRSASLRKRSSEFRSIQEARGSLPVAQWRAKLIHQIASNGAVIVSGATGSGKTTQVPQFVLEEALQDTGGQAVALPNIIVTEPRRISAISVANRVSQELGDPAGGPGSGGALVGYQIRLERKVTASTRLLFCTVGVLLRRFQQGTKTSLDRVTHIFIDEVHERSAECDLLLMLLRQLQEERPQVRIILMSATLEVEKIAHYFGAGGNGNAVHLSIPGRTFPIEVFWLEDVIEKTRYQPEEDSEFFKPWWSGTLDPQSPTLEGKSNVRVKKISVTPYLPDDGECAGDDEAESANASHYSNGTLLTLSRMDHDRINYELIEATLLHIEESRSTMDRAEDDAAVLVFLPGLAEITRTRDLLQRSPIFGDESRCLIISLHSMLSGEEHTRAFERPPRGIRKIVLSTNMAETGVTIPDVVYVIDTGKVKSQRYHEASSTSSLREVFVSRAEALQRRGRAGRVRPGICFHLFTRKRFEQRFQAIPTPEILRCSLMDLMLSVLSAGLQPGSFSLTLDPPPQSRIVQSCNTLKALGAVEEVLRPLGAPRTAIIGDETWYEVTPLGHNLARLPVDARLGKMALLAGLFGGIQSVWTVAATLSHRSPLATPREEKQRGKARLAHCAELLMHDAPPSDHLALSVAYSKWEAAKNGKAADAFCRRAWLNKQVLQQLREVRQSLVNSVKGEGFYEDLSPAEAPAEALLSPRLSAALIFAGLYPNIARVDPPTAALEKRPVYSAGGEQIKLHPGSLCFGRDSNLHRRNCRWLTFHEKVRTSQLFLRDCTILPPNAVLLFAAEPAAMNIHPLEESVSLGVGGERNWQTLRIAPRTAALIRQLRYAFDGLVRSKAMDPRRPLTAQERAVIAAYISVLLSGTDNDKDASKAA